MNRIPSRVHVVRLNRFLHIGHVVTDRDAAIARYEATFGVSVALREVLDEQGVEAVALEAGSSVIELIQPVSPESAVARFLDRRGEGLHHVAYEVDDLHATLAELAGDGVDLIDREPRVGLGGHHIAFLHPRSTGGVLTELVEAEDASHGGAE